jgi:hypothetical protein
LNPRLRGALCSLPRARRAFVPLNYRPTIEWSVGHSSYAFRKPQKKIHIAGRRQKSSRPPPAATFFWIRLPLLEPLISYLPYLALLVRVWMGATLMIHGRPKLVKKNREQTIRISGRRASSDRNPPGRDFGILWRAVPRRRTLGPNRGSFLRD